MLIDGIANILNTLKSTQMSVIGKNITQDEALILFDKVNTEENRQASYNRNIDVALRIIKGFVINTDEDCSKILKRCINEKIFNHSDELLSNAFKKELCKKSKSLTTEEITELLSVVTDRAWRDALLSHPSCKQNDALKLLKEVSKLDKPTVVKNENYVRRASNLSKIEDFDNDVILNNPLSFNYNRIFSIKDEKVLEMRLKKLESIIKEDNENFVNSNNNYNWRYFRTNICDSLYDNMKLLEPMKGRVLQLIDDIDYNKYISQHSANSYLLDGIISAHLVYHKYVSYTHWLSDMIVKPLILNNITFDHNRLDIVCQAMKSEEFTNMIKSYKQDGLTIKSADKQADGLMSVVKNAQLFIQNELNRFEIYLIYYGYYVSKPKFNYNNTLLTIKISDTGFEIVK